MKSPSKHRAAAGHQLPCATGRLRVARPSVLLDASHCGSLLDLVSMRRIVLQLLFVVVGSSLAEAATVTLDSPTPAELKPSSWVSRCTSDSRNAPLVCSIEESVVLANTGQVVANVVVTQTNPKEPIMTIRVPAGIYLPA